MIIYGSFAISHWFDDYFKQPSDIDVVSYNDTLINQTYLQNLSKEYNLPLELTYQKDGYFFNVFEDMTSDYYLNPEGILTVKMSHAMYDYNLDKTINDIIFLQQKNIKYDIDKLMHLRNYWKERYKGFREKMDFNKHPNDFFTSSVTRYINHDELHNKLKLYNIPAFQKIIESADTVKVSREKFNQLTEEEKISTFIEEIAVLACERYFLNTDPKEAFVLASQDFLTRMTSGWYNIFLLENIYTVFKFVNSSENDNYFEVMNRIMNTLRTKHYNNKIMINNI